MRHVLQFLLLSVFVASGPALAVPTHYLVLEFADGQAVPVYYVQVDLAADRGGPASVPPAASTADRIRWHGGDGRAHEVAMPEILRAEFARDPESATSAIDAVPIPNHQRSFVLRVPLDQDAIDLELPGGATQRLDLAGIAARAASLPLAGRVPVVARGAPAGGDPGNRLDVLVLGDGYTAGQQDLFDTHAAALRSGMFGITPYMEYESYANWTPAFVVSQDAGATHPPYQADCSTGDCCADTDAQNDPLAGQVTTTAFQSRFCAFNIHRLLVANNSLVLAAAGAYPDWDVVLVSVNDPVYGGSGGVVGVLSQHPAAQEVTIHEFGHTFTGLADEYSTPYPGFPPCDDTLTQRCEANVTNVTDRPQIKWHDLIDPDLPVPTPAGMPGIGLFEGARYELFGMYRPADQCEMRQLGVEFCTVCRQEYVKRLYGGWGGRPAGGIDPIEPGSESPVTTQPFVYAAGSDRVFAATLLQPSIGAHDAQWYLDGEPIAGANEASYVFSQATTTPAARTLELRVSDPTALVIPSMADGLLASSRSWTIHVVEDDTLFEDGFDLPF